MDGYKDYCVTIEYCNYEHREDYIIEAETEEEAKKDAMEWAIDELSVVDVEDLDTESKYLKFRNYILRQVDKKGNEWTLLDNRDIHYLIRIAERISLPNVKRVEVIGTNEPVDTFKSWSVLFTREF